MTAETTPAPTKDALPIAAIKAMRPKQWTKNVLLLAALIFSVQFTELDKVLYALWGVGAFSLMSSSGYIFNDLMDRDADALHPEKRFRPIASGALPVGAAWALGTVSLILGLSLGFLLNPWFAAIAAVYWLNTMSYSFWGKHQVILDIMMIAAGFLLRAIAGAVAISVPISPWLLLCAGFLALFLGFNKRRGELLSVGDSGQRKSLKSYNTNLLEEIQAVTSSGTIISYALYTVLGSPTPWLLLTFPLPMYAIFRYMYLVQQGKTGDPSKVLLTDKPILLICLVYAGLAMGLLLFAPKGGGMLFGPL